MKKNEINKITDYLRKEAYEKGLTILFSITSNNSHEVCGGVINSSNMDFFYMANGLLNEALDRLKNTLSAETYENLVEITTCFLQKKPHPGMTQEFKELFSRNSKESIN